MVTSTSLPAASKLPRFILIKSNYYSDQGYAHYNDAGSVILGEESVFSTLVKIEVERATCNDRYVHLRFCNSNRYWARKGRFIVADSSKPEEDTTKSSCTLFEAVNVAGTGFFYLNHVQSGGGRLLLDPSSMIFYINENPEANQGYLSFVNWDTLVILPKHVHVVFKGYNGRYLGGVTVDGNGYLQFSFDDPNAEVLGHEVHLTPDGHVRIKSRHLDRFWRRDRDPNWIRADSTDTTASDRDTLFWPIKIDDTTIALRNAGNSRFCRALPVQGQTTRLCLNAAGPTVSAEAKMVVQELVTDRYIENVEYRVEDARVFNERRFVAGTTSAYNLGETEAGIAVEVKYADTRAYSVSRSLSLTAGVVTFIFIGGMPLIDMGTFKEVDYQDTRWMEGWNVARHEVNEVKATGSVRVPPKSMASVSYVGTTGTCDIPFSYTQRDRSSTDGRSIESGHIDGVYRGINSYNFSFVVEEIKPL